MKAGHWRSMTELTVNGKSTPPKTSPRCFSSSELNSMHIFEPTDKLPIAEATFCTSKNFSFDGQIARWTTVCTLKNSGEAIVNFENKADATHAYTLSHLDAHMSGQTRTMTVKTTLERTGSCPN